MMSPIQPRPSSGNRCYTVQDLQDILGVGRKSVYSLLKRKEFRWIQVGAVYRIPKKSLMIGSIPVTVNLRKIKSFTVAPGHLAGSVLFFVIRSEFARQYQKKSVSGTQ